MRSQSLPNGPRWQVTGVLLGLLASGLLVVGWQRSSQELSVSILGAGREASVLITSDHRRILIVAGTNGAAFSNALAAALPPIDNELDLVLVDPSASADVRDRVRSLDANVTWSLPAPEEPLAVDAIERSFIVELSEQSQFRMIVISGGLWKAELVSSAGTVVISPSAQGVVERIPDAAVLVLVHEAAEIDADVPLIIGVPGFKATAEQQTRVVSPGSVVRVDLLDHEIRTGST